MGGTPRSSDLRGPLTICSSLAETLERYKLERLELKRRFFIVPLRDMSLNKRSNTGAGLALLFLHSKAYKHKVSSAGRQGT